MLDAKNNLKKKKKYCFNIFPINNNLKNSYNTLKHPIIILTKCYSK